MVLTGRDVWSRTGACANGGSDGGRRGMAIMINGCQNPPYRNRYGSSQHRRNDEINFQSSLTASNQVPNVIKRVHEAATVDFCDHAKRCRYDNTDCYSNGNKRNYVGMDTYQDLVETNEKRCRLDDTGDNDMDVDFNLGQLFSEPEYTEELKEEQHFQSHQQKQQQQESQTQTQIPVQIFQDQKTDFYTMVHGNFELNSHAIKIAEFPESIDDVEYMYQTTHGGDFMRHLNNYPGEDL